MYKRKNTFLLFILLICALLFINFSPVQSEALPEDLSEDVVEELREELPEQLPDESAFELYYNHRFKEISGSYADPLLEQFGYDVFRYSDDFRAITELSVGPEYVIGPGDSLIISVSGSTYFEENPEVDRDGQISISDVGKVSVWGMELGEAREVITNKIEEYYSNISVTVTMDELRSIAVYVVGEVENPGIKKMGSLSTVLHGLFEAGGPTKTGSLRNIRIVREEEVIAEMDLYDFLLEGKREHDLRLKTGDTIHVPSIKDTFAIGGQVRRPAVYEAAEELRLSELIEKSGGLSSLASLSNILIERIKKGEEKVLKEISLPSSLAEFSGTEADIYLKDGDMVYIGSIIGHRVPEVKGYVGISGNIEHPGDYEWEEDMTIKELIERAGGVLPDTMLERAEVYRYISEENRETIAVNLEQALAEDPEHNIELEEWDQVNIFAEYDIFPERTVEAVGELNEPGVYELTPNMTLRDLVFAAHEPTEKAYLQRAEIFRKRTEKRREVIPVDLNKVLDEDKEVEIELKSDDILRVYSVDWVFPEQRVQIQGAVHEPGQFELYEDMKLRDLIFAAGGLESEAYREKIEIYRPNYGKKYFSELIEVDVTVLDLDKKEAGEHDESESKDEAESVVAEEDILLQEGDRVFVRTHIEDKKIRDITITGEVNLPGEYVIESGETLASVIKRAGGLTPRAYPFGAVFNREQIRERQRSELQDYINYQQQLIEEQKAEIMEMPLTGEERERKKAALDHQQRALELMEAQMPEGRIIFDLERALADKNSAHNLMLADSDELHIPARPQVVILIGEVYNPESIIYESDREIDYYLDKVGGVRDSGAAEEIYLLRADGSVVSDPENIGEIKEGDMIIVPPEDGLERLGGVQ